VPGEKVPGEGRARSPALALPPRRSLVGASSDCRAPNRETEIWALIVSAPGQVFCGHAEVANAVYSRLDAARRMRSGLVLSKLHARMQLRTTYQRQHCPFESKLAVAQTDLIFLDCLDYRRCANFPELSYSFFQQGHRIGESAQPCSLPFPVGVLMDHWSICYINRSSVFGILSGWPVVGGEICVDQFGYNPAFCGPVRGAHI